MTEITKEQLLKTGLKLLDSSGRGSLKISTICSTLKLTKGAFYHWFKSKKEFDLNLLAYWRELFTREFILNANVGENAKEKLSRLINNCINSSKVNSRLEVEINMWGHQDPDIREVVEQVYDERFHYLLALLEDIYPSKEEAKRHALIIYSLIIGVDLFYKKMSKQEMQLVFKAYLI